MKKTSKILSVVLAILMVISIIPITSSAETPTSGTCGDNLTWEFDTESGTLTLNGSGEIPDYYNDKYTPENGNIKVYVGFIYNDAYIKIIDDGIGIPKEDLDKIYERFYRVDKARTREMGGTGLGLSIAKEILDQNDSMIDIKSDLGKGTEVVIRIPTKQGKNNKDIKIVSSVDIKKINDYTCSVLFDSRNINAVSQINTIIIPRSSYATDYMSIYAIGTLFVQMTLVYNCRKL